MRIGWGDDVDEVRAFAIDHFAPVGVVAPNAELRHRCAGLLFRAIAHGSNFHFRYARPCFILEAREIPGSDADTFHSPNTLLAVPRRMWRLSSSAMSNVRILPISTPRLSGRSDPTISLLLGTCA